MEDMQTVIILMTAVIIIHSVTIIVLFGVIIALLTKLKRLVNHAEATVSNIAQATEWLSPVKLFTEVVQLFRKK
ncbi:hypothetical protein FBF29_03785 [Candidatus Saccharibacteria bacterium oral taxon 488]|nr:hypothetical protein FBF29_03785 [Candidatus Saccharibacteria bacterium oral taxon 488]